MFSSSQAIERDVADRASEVVFYKKVEWSTMRGEDAMAPRKLLRWPRLPHKLMPHSRCQRGASVDVTSARPVFILMPLMTVQSD